MFRYRLFFVSLFVLMPLSACSKPQIKPLSEPIFRLQTSQKPTGCNSSKGGKPCRWDIVGRIIHFGIPEDGENPFRDCNSCVFNQKFIIEDIRKTRHTIYYKLPSEDLVPVQNDWAVRVTYIDASQVGRGYALKIARQQGLLFVVTSGAGGEMLVENSLAPLTITVDNSQQAGQEAGTCGTKIFRYLNFKSGDNQVKAAPGEIKELLGSDKKIYRVANINRFNWKGSKCTDLSAPPFSFFAFQTVKTPN